MSELVPPGAKPLAVWEANDFNGLYWRHWREASPWAVDHIADAHSTYRVDFYLLDAPFAVVYRHQRDEDGNVRLDPATGDPMLAEPVIQLLDELPPAHLLERITR